MTPEEIRSLYDYNAWANHRVLDACEALAEEQFARNLGASFPSARDTLVHIMGAEWVWLERWNGRSPNSVPWTDAFTHAAEVRTRWAGIERNLLDFVAAVAAPDLGRVVEYCNVHGHRFAYPLQSMLQHLVNHGTYHRGQVTSMLRQLGAEPRPTDLLRYLDALAGDPED
jgi:uncharacterized damage-inducible protein DinB